MRNKCDILISSLLQRACVLIPAPAFYLLSGQKEFNFLSQSTCMQYDNNITYAVVEESKLVVMCTLCSKDIEQNMNL